MNLNSDIVEIIHEYAEEPNLLTIYAKNNTFNRNRYSKLLTKKFGDLARNYETALADIKHELYDEAFIKSYYLLEAASNPKISVLDDRTVIQKLIERRDLDIFYFVIGLYIDDEIWRNFLINLLIHLPHADGFWFPKIAERTKLHFELPDITITFGSYVGYSVNHYLSDAYKKFYKEYLEFWKLEKQFAKI